MGLQLVHCLASLEYNSLEFLLRIMNLGFFLKIGAFDPLLNQCKLAHTCRGKPQVQEIHLLLTEATITNRNFRHFRNWL